MIQVTAWFLVIGLLLAPPAVAQTGSPASSPSAKPVDLPFAIDGPAPPVPPATISRDQSGRATVRAVRLAAPLRIDGQLDESVYHDTPPISDFIQGEPHEGQPATEKTDVWVTFDSKNVYVSFRCWESQPDKIVATEMRRDGAIIFTGDDSVLFQFDTFYDRRNSFVFTTNPLGARMEGQVTNERQYSGDWNPVWEIKAGRFENGWTIEASVPFKSLRYRPGRSQVWGFNVRRYNRYKNEFSHITRIPAARGPQAYQQASFAATLVGLETPPGSKNLEIKPYATSSLTTDRNLRPPLSDDLSSDVGLDVKYGITQNLTSDFTYNTDFAQVEADEQQINLTRYSLFFPEKREFFLENQGLFNFGNVTTMNASGDTPLLFYSRRIGLEQGAVVPIQGGGRLTGRVGRFSIGALNIRTDDDTKAGIRATNFSVMRLKRDLLRRSSVGLIATRRSPGTDGTESSSAYGIDSTLAFFDNLTISSYWARTEGSRPRVDTSYRAQLDYAGDRYGVQAERLVIGDNFDPQVGFVRRYDMRKTSGLIRFSPRPKSIKAVRKFSWIGSGSRVENAAGRLETRDINGEFDVDFQNGDRFTVTYDDVYEFLPKPLSLPSGVSVPIGGYSFANARVAYNLGRQRKISGSFSAAYGTYYNGHKATVGISRGRMNVSSQLSIEPSYSINRVELLSGSFTAHLLGSRVTYTMTPLMFTSALIQYNSTSHAITANVRLRWEYRAGSEFFVVFNEQRDTQSVRFPSLANRALIIKINRLLRL